VTHECNYPREALGKRRLVKVAFDPDKLTSRQIDEKIANLLRTGKDIYEIDTETLNRIKPELVLAQGLCEVCSPFAKVVAGAVNLLANKPQILVLDPHNFDDILHNINDIARAICKTTQGIALTVQLQKRIDRVKGLCDDSPPRILCLEWLDPFYTAGHWIPQMVELAGGVNGISETGERSRRTSVNEIAQFDPDKIILMPCGFSKMRTIKEYEPIRKNPEWQSIRAVQEGQVYAVDANSYFSKPGPRTIVGLEILAKIIAPEKSRRIKVPRGSYKKIGSGRSLSQ
jgi:iron complex transport system substrate-binding protein